MRFRYGLLKSLAVVLGVVGFTTVVQVMVLFGVPRRSPSDANDVAVTVKNDSRPVRPALGGDLFRVAIGGAISSIGIPELNPDTIHRLPMFSVLFPSFCRTASAGFLYHFYFGYDYDDALGNVTIRNAVVDAFDTQMASSCDWLPERPQLHLLECQYVGKPAWAQNDAMVAAYVDGMDFFYRLNDDTLLVTRNWTAIFVEKLGQMSPQYVGAVGPFCKRGPRIKILTHDFVHRTHLEIFGYYYPRLFTDWYADNWITHVYGKNVRAFVLDEVFVNHTEPLGKRYMVQKTGEAMEWLTNYTARKDHKLVERYMTMFFPEGRPTRCRYMKRCSISIILYGNDTGQTMGAIRNAQLAPVLYPGWKLRIYYHPRPTTTADPAESGFAHLYVPDNVLRTLEILDAKLVPVTNQQIQGNPRTWRRLVFEDSINDDLVLVWQAGSPLSDEREFFTS